MKRLLSTIIAISLLAMTTASAMQQRWGMTAIAEEIKTHSDSCIPLSKQVVQMAENFDLDGIQKLADELDAC